MRRLTEEEIECLASRPGVKRIAVENFHSTLYLPAGFRGNVENAEADAQSYGWNGVTFRAIMVGICLATMPES